MEITEVRIKLMEDSSERLKAFCSITFDSCFVVRDLKIIEGSNGFFVAMPSRKMTVHCHKCHVKNHSKANYCNQCGARIDQSYQQKTGNGRAKLYADIAHPINSQCREMIQKIVVEAFEDEKIKALDPNYVSVYDDYAYDFEDSEIQETYFDAPHRSQHVPHRIKVPMSEQEVAGSAGESSNGKFGYGVF